MYELIPVDFEKQKLRRNFQNVRKYCPRVRNTWQLVKKWLETMLIRQGNLPGGFNRAGCGAFPNRYYDITIPGAGKPWETHSSPPLSHQSIACNI